MNYLEVIEGLCRVCTELAEIVRLQACDPAFHADDAEVFLARAADHYKEITGDELLERR